MLPSLTSGIVPHQPHHDTGKSLQIIAPWQFVEWSANVFDNAHLDDAAALPAMRCLLAGGQNRQDRELARLCCRAYLPRLAALIKFHNQRGRTDER